MVELSSPVEMSLLCQKRQLKVSSYSWYVLLRYLPDSTSFKARTTQVPCESPKEGPGGISSWCGHVGLLAPEEKLAVACCQNSVYYGAGRCG